MQLRIDMKLLLTQKSLTQIQEYLSKCVESDERFLVTVGKYKSNRSLEQNAKLHGLLRDIAQFTGNTVGEIKDYVCGEFLGEQTYEWQGQTRTRRVPTSELSVTEFGELIERVQQLAVELGV